MPFVKLDTEIVRSTLWIDADARIVFITALLLAQPFELEDATPQLKVRDLEPTGWTVPPGWYGFAPCAGIGIVREASIDTERGLDALERLGSPDRESRSRDFDGRRLVRVDGGYIVLNYMKFRDRDYSAKERMRRLRERRRKAVTRNDRNVRPNVTHSREQRAEAKVEERITDSPSAVSLQPSRSKGRQRNETGASTKTTWLTPYVDVFREICPKGTAPAGLIAKTLRPLDRQHGPFAVVQELRAYLRSTPLAYVSLPKFETGFGTWRAGGGGKPTILEQSREAIEAFVAGGKP